MHDTAEVIHVGYEPIVQHIKNGSVNYNILYSAKQECMGII